jgi:hypothetical protein
VLDRRPDGGHSARAERDGSKKNSRVEIRRAEKCARPSSDLDLSSEQRASLAGTVSPALPPRPASGFLPACSEREYVLGPVQVKSPLRAVDRLSTTMDALGNQRLGEMRVALRLGMVVLNLLWVATITSDDFQQTVCLSSPEGFGDLGRSLFGCAPPCMLPGCSRWSGLFSVHSSPSLALRPPLRSRFSPSVTNSGYCIGRFPLAYRSRIGTGLYGPSSFVLGAATACRCNRVRGRRGMGRAPLAGTAAPGPRGRVRGSSPRPQRAPRAPAARRAILVAAGPTSRSQRVCSSTSNGLSGTAAPEEAVAVSRRILDVYYRAALGEQLPRRAELAALERLLSRRS